MLYKQFIELFDILDSAEASGAQVKAYLEGIYKEGAERASHLAAKTLRKVYKKVGFVAR